MKNTFGINDINLVAATDSYKITHWRQYPAWTKTIFSFFESRGGEFPEVTFFGLQYILKRYFEGIVITQEDVNEMAEDCALHFGDPSLFNMKGWKRILEVHGGRLPILIRAIPEGTSIPNGNVLMTIENTDPELPWLTNYVETLLSQVWYPCTVATQSRQMKKLIIRYLEETGDPGLIDFKLHDFGFRGSTSVESAGIGGAAHLVNFKGSDTIQALRVARKYYKERMAGFSIPAAEHSTVTSWGRENEVEAYRNMLIAFPQGMVAVVSDSYDVFTACEELWGKKLRDMVEDRDGVLVVRPDSGEPAEVVLKVLEALGRSFGYTINDKGYRVLNPKVRVIQGDGIDYPTIGKILETMKQAGWSADNTAFGSGGALLQKVNRDTLKFAFKCCAALVGNTWRDVMKNPVTDPGKKSKAGRLVLVKVDGQFKTLREEEAQSQGLENLLVPVFKDGKLLFDQTFDEIRTRALVD